MFVNVTVLLLLAFILVGCGERRAPEGARFSLYRNSVTDENMRIHVATFDAADGEAYNRGNCDIARDLFQAQPGVKVKFWCEKGSFRK